MNRQAYKLFHDGVRAFADMEANGIRIDIKHMQKQRNIADAKIKKLEAKIEDSEEGRAWKKLFKNSKTKFNIDSNVQLAKLLGHLGITPPKVTPKGNPSVDKDSLHLIKLPIIKPLMELRKQKKLSNTFLKGIIEETVDGYLHPSFNLHIPLTYRGSSQDPNFQNLPIRDPVMGKIIRMGFIPRDGFMIGGFDYGGIELSMSGCNSKDPLLIKNFFNIHLEEAANCYAMCESQVTKDVRYNGKNGFVFPELYGSWYEQCAMNLWKAIREMKLTTKSGIPLYQWLKGEDIYNVTDFIDHVQGVEDRFWKRYHVHKDWQEGWLHNYSKKGYIEMLTGFKCGGIMTKNQLLNYANQGPAFHCLLWSLIRMNRWLKKYKMKSKVIGQIHDDMVMDIYLKEKEDVLHQAKKIMCEDIKKAWRWIITPLVLEAEFSEVNWYEKEEIKV